MASGSGRTLDQRNSQGKKSPESKSQVISKKEGEY